MSTRRLERVNELIKRCLADAWLRHAAGDPALTAATFIRVECTPDLRQARVFISALAEAGVPAEALLPALYDQRKWLQHEVATHARLKYTPHLRFIVDDSVARGDRVLAILAEVTPLIQPEPGDAEPDAEPPAPEEPPHVTG